MPRYTKTFYGYTNQSFQAVFYTEAIIFISLISIFSIWIYAKMRFNEGRNIFNKGRDDSDIVIDLPDFCSSYSLSNRLTHVQGIALQSS